jgi:hypothetical protein
VSRRTKILLGIGSIAPVILGGLYTAGFIVLWAGDGFEGDEPPTLFFVLFGVIAVAVLESWAMIAYYVVWLVRQPYADDGKKTLWIVLLLIAGSFALPIFWFLYVWREESLAPAQPRWGQWQQPPPPPPPAPPFAAH